MMTMYKERGTHTCISNLKRLVLLKILLMKQNFWPKCMLEMIQKL